MLNLGDFDEHFERPLRIDSMAFNEYPFGDVDVRSGLHGPSQPVRLRQRCHGDFECMPGVFLCSVGSGIEDVRAFLCPAATAPHDCTVFIHAVGVGAEVDVGIRRFGDRSPPPDLQQAAGLAARL